jgi:hypothetical protein
LAFFDDGAALALHIEEPIALNTNGARSGGLRRNCITKLVNVDPVAERLGFARVFGHFLFVIYGRLGKHEA